MRIDSILRRRWQLAAVILVLVVGPGAAHADGTPPGFRHYLTGNAADVVRPTSGLLVLQGGGDDVDENYIRMGAHGGGGDFVVLRATGADEYDPYIYGLCHCDSVETLVVDSREAAFDPYVVQTVRNAEEYYRRMFGGRVTSWNLRDTHMAQTLDALLAHLDSAAQPARIVVWAHNSHVGDARATEVGGDGQLTLGQLVREEHGADCRLIGFSTYHGTVTAATEWGGNAFIKTVRPALPGSVEELFHETGRAAFLVAMHDGGPAAQALEVVRLARAIGVIYLPETERQSHYYHVRPADQYDAMIHLERTRALQPLDPTSIWIEGQTPETYPSGL